MIWDRIHSFCKIITDNFFYFKPDFRLIFLKICQFFPKSVNFSYFLLFPISLYFFECYSSELYSCNNFQLFPFIFQTFFRTVYEFLCMKVKNFLENSFSCVSIGFGLDLFLLQTEHINLRDKPFIYRSFLWVRSKVVNVKTKYHWHTPL